MSIYRNFLIACEGNIRLWKLLTGAGTSARNGPVFAGIPYRNFFLFMTFISALITMHYINLSFSIFLALYHYFYFKKQAIF
jgi:hypothetical protein